MTPHDCPECGRSLAWCWVRKHKREHWYFFAMVRGGAGACPYCNAAITRGPNPNEGRLVGFGFYAAAATAMWAAVAPGVLWALSAMLLPGLFIFRGARSRNVPRWVRATDL